MTKLRHAGIVVRNMDRSITFYCDVLGVSRGQVHEESGPFLDGLLAFSDARVKTAKIGGGEGSSLIELLQFESPEPQTCDHALNAIGPTHIALTVVDLDQLYQCLLDKGIAFNAPPAVSPNGLAKVAFCQDPDGTFLELVEELQVD